jgi:hypothetical protein
MTAPPSLSYADFLASKRLSAPSAGFESINPLWIPDGLFPHQEVSVRWALQKGRAAVFGDTGTGKTRIEAAWAGYIQAAADKPVLVLTPLAVAPDWVGEAAALNIRANVCLSQKDVKPGQITVANYDRLHLFELDRFIAGALDESSILKSFSGATCRSLIDGFSRTPYRLAASATPSPNDYTELGNHAEFLGVMTRTEMLATFFTHDGGDTSKWRLKRHAVKAFWEWVGTWAIAFRKPSDLNPAFSDDGYVLPPLHIHRHEIDFQTVVPEGRLFEDEAVTLTDQRSVKRGSLSARVAKVAELVAAEPDEPWLIWCELNDEGGALEKAIPGAVQVSGSDTTAFKEDRMRDFSEGRLRVLISKPAICGFGMNWQHAARMASVGIDHSHEKWYQCVRREWRFGQTRPVHAHVIHTPQEAPIVRSLKEKEARAETMAEEMIGLMNSREQVGAIQEATDRETETYRRDVARGANWELRLGDCVEGLREVEDDSVGYSVFSPPFASLYTYTNSQRDMGNCRGQDDFVEHFRFAVRELHRVLMPGRLLSFHCMDLPLGKARDGVIGLRDFRGELIRLFEAEGFVLHSQVVIWKDPVTAMQRTKAIGLLHKQLVKDSALSRQGIPDYLVTMRKRGDNPVPVVGRLAEYHGTDQWEISSPLPPCDGTRDELPTNQRQSIEIWQRYASPVWMDINPSRTLQYTSAREEADERHICPLQLDVIERGVQLWSLPGDLILSPFAGIASEGYVSVLRGRRFLGFELKESYWKQGCHNLRRAETEAGQQSLFSLDAEELAVAA